MGESKEAVFILPDEKVKIKFIKRSIGIAADVADNHIISGGMLEGSYRKFPVPMQRNGGLKNVLTTAEKDFFEGKGGPFEGQKLSMYSKFWDNQYVTLGKLGTTLDLSIPHDYIKYKILLGWTSVIAPSLKIYKEQPSPAYQFYLERDGEETRLQSKNLNITKTAWRNFSKIEDNREVLSAVIFLMTGKKVAGNAKLEYLNTEVEKLVDNKAEKFNLLLGDAQFETKILIANAERAGIIKKVKGAYETKDGLAITDKGQPATVQNVVAFLNDPINNEVKELILSRLDNIKE